MKLLVFCGLLALALAASSSRRHSSWSRDAESFRSGQEYLYRYRSQVSSGIGSTDQHATHMISSDVYINFETERRATLRLQDVTVGIRNDILEEPRHLQHQNSFEPKDIEEKLLAELEMPIQFEYVDGIVERINFNEKDSAWSKNIKRAVLNLLQLNMKRRNSGVQGSEYEREYKDDDRTESLTQMFSLPERTLEGECQTVYSINSRQAAKENFNVTKSIDFSSCTQTAFLRYGPRLEKQTAQLHQSEVDRQQLDRSTVYRYQLIGSPESYGIGHVEVLSQYVYKLLNAEEQQPMQTIAVGELSFQSQQRKSSPEVNVSNKEETLLYSMERDTLKRRFYQYGDEEFTATSTPFAHIPSKVKSVVKLIEEVAKQSTDFTNGIPEEASSMVQEIVELIRMCRVEELEKILAELDRDQRNIFIDALAIAGTRNSVHFLVENIIKREISTPKAIQSLRQVTGLYAISSKHTEEIQRLCKSSVAKESAALRQSCWLTFGSLVGELCKETSYLTTQEFQAQCPRHLKEKLQNILNSQYEEAVTTYDKILMLKSLGNAAIDTSVYKLEKVINSKREVTVVRQQAIDSLRRLRNQMPLKIQRILLPLLKNVQERPEIRMAAFSMIMSTIPQKSTLDQITYILFNERSQHVRSFVYTALRAYSKSTVEAEKELAKHLQTVLKMNPIDKDELRWSRFYRVPLYSQEQREGLLFNLASGFASGSNMPQYLSFSVDSLLNNMLETKNLELTLTQSNLEKIFSSIYEQLNNGRLSLRSNRYGSMENGRELIDGIFDALKTQRRGDKTTYGMISLRIRDVDHVILPLSEELPEMLRDMSVSDLLDQERRSFHYNTIASMQERVIKVATVAGLPLRMSHGLPVVAGAEGQFHIQPQGKGVRVRLQLKPLLNGVHIQRMELWSPIINTGVESRQTLAMNLPINMEVMASLESDEKVKITFTLPEEKTRLVTLSSLPMTYSRSFIPESQLYQEARGMAIRNRRMESLLVELPEENRERTLSVSGFYHKPSTLSYRSLFGIVSVSENQIIIDFTPLSHTPKSLEMIVKSKLFHQVEKSSHRPEFKSFYDSSKFERIDESLDKYISSTYKANKVYEHSVNVLFKTVGGRSQHETDIKLRATCDSHLTFCKLVADLRAAPLENGEWTFKSNSQILVPEYVNDIEELKENEQNKFAVEFDCEWGFDRKERLALKINGERAVSQKWIARKWHRNLATAFLNKYDIVADYKLDQETKNWVTRGWNLFKMAFYWDLAVDKTVQGKSNEIYTTVIIDPVSRKYVNMTVKTPTELVKINNMILPFSVKPFALVRSQEDSFEIHSASQLLHKVSDDYHRAECRVDGRKIKTFDSVIYKAPLGECYSVIAKDCVDKTFAVLMKTLDQSTQQKKLKVLNHRDVIEVSSQFQSELVVKINGRKVEDVEELREQGIERSDEMVRVTLSQGVTIRFNGKQATVKLSQYYQDKQCGLCGEFNDEDHDEFRKSDDTLTDDVKDFHRSYSMVKGDEECEASEHKKIYNDDSLFEKRMTSRRSERFEEDENYDSAVELDDEVESYGHFDRREDQDSSEESEIRPVLRTKVIEYNHKICFSLKPIKMCPRGAIATETDTIKATFTCPNRSSPETRRLLRKARSQDITDELVKSKITYNEAVKAAKICSPQ